MRKKTLRTVLLLAALSTASAGSAATISWKLPTSYSDGTPIDPADVRKIEITVYAGPARTGPWKWVATSLPGTTSVTAMDPAPGQTLWYTVRARLNGVESERADPVRATNHFHWIVPFLKKVATKMLTVKKMAALGILLLLVGLAWRFRHGRKHPPPPSGGSFRRT